jgi:hypothetical protein
MNARFKFILGQVTIECEGSEAFVREGLTDLLATAYEKLQGMQPPAQDAGSSLAGTAFKRSDQPSSPAYSTSMIAAKIGCETGQDLILAAAGKLAFSDGIQFFTRKQLLDAMKSAAAYYRETYSGNLTKYLLQLVREGRLDEMADGTYALTASASQDIRGRMADTSS